VSDERISAGCNQDCSSGLSEFNYAGEEKVQSRGDEQYGRKSEVFGGKKEERVSEKICGGRGDEERNSISNGSDDGFCEHAFPFMIAVKQKSCSERQRKPQNSDQNRKLSEDVKGKENCKINSQQNMQEDFHDNYHFQLKGPLDYIMFSLDEFPHLVGAIFIILPIILMVQKGFIKVDTIFLKIFWCVVIALVLVVLRLVGYFYGKKRGWYLQDF